MGKKWVYLFTEGNADMRELLGGKGANYGLRCFGYHHQAGNWNVLLVRQFYHGL